MFVCLMQSQYTPVRRGLNPYSAKLGIINFQSFKFCLAAATHN